jgi:exosortase E/protease (VPEID-CTERM system)
MAERPALVQTPPSFRLNVPGRLGLLGTLLFAEKIALSFLIDARRARDAEGLGAFLHAAQHWGFRYLVTFLTAVSVLACVKAHPAQVPREVMVQPADVSVRWMLAHVLILAALGPLSYFLFRSDLTALGLASLAGLWLVGCTSAIIAASIGLIPTTIWLQGIRSIGIGWIYAAIIALLGTGAWLVCEKLWNSATAITFKLVTWVLMPVLTLSYSDPATRVIATPRFAVEITEVCSGLEGLGLTLAFSVLWLAYFRREYIFPRALILIPLSLVAIFGLNVLRIAALLAIGDAGHPDVASFGFHSQAGWIAFNAVACALVFFSRRSSWLNRTAASATRSTDAHNPTATYLIPLLSILAAGAISHALSGRFETFYPLRLVAAVAALFALRHSLLALKWRFTWRGPAVGTGVFLLWIAAAHRLLPSLPEPAPLTALLPLERALWVACHCLTSTVLVPIAEELAYRGYLMRRLASPEFESLPYESVRWPALMITSIVFGAAHGALWLPGIVAGIAYGLLVIRLGRLGEGIAAHATTNGLIAITVIAGNQWQLW